MIKKLFISGQVQGVGFRYWTKKHAQKFNLVGYVRNLASGEVEVVIKGDKGDLEKLINKINEGGPMLAKVHNVDIKEIDNLKDLPGVNEDKFVIVK